VEIEKGKIALFIDADNAPSKKIDFILTELASYGVVNIRKAYGNWSNQNISGWASCLHDNAIQPVQQFDLIKGKNATDMAMTIDCMDIMFTKDINTFCIISSDCDFTPLVMRLLAEGKSVIGFGELKTPKPFVNACSKFLYLNSEEQGIIDAKSSKLPSPPLSCDTRLVNLFRSAIEACSDTKGWAPLMNVVRHINNHTSFDVKNYGFKKVVDLIEAIGLFDVKVIKGTQVMIADSRSKK
jgi:uncharacterized protein (TIGR00288 family)